MFIVDSYALAVVFCFVTMLCWGSWGNTQKMAAKTWRYELFYWDYVIGMFLFALILSLTMGELRFRRPAVPARSGTGLRSQYRERTVGRRDLQRIEYPALRLDRAGRHGRRIPAGRGPRAGSRRDHQLCGCAERRSCDSVRRRGADRGGDRLQRHRFGTNAEGCGRQLEQPQRASCWRWWPAY